MCHPCPTPPSTRRASNTCIGLMDSTVPEEEIGGLVYGLYGVTEEEEEVVEGENV